MLDYDVMRKFQYLCLQVSMFCTRYLFIGYMEERIKGNKCCNLSHIQCLAISCENLSLFKKLFYFYLFTTYDHFLEKVFNIST